MSTRKSRQTTAKAVLTLPERTRRLYKTLGRQIDGTHFTNALKTCEMLVKLDAEDQEARKIKLFLLLQTEKYREALALIGDDETKSFERIYSLYKLGKDQEAIVGIEEMNLQTRSSNDNGWAERGVKHLEAQLKYRKGLYAESLEMYNELLDTSDPSGEEYQDIQSNIAAATAYLDFITRDYQRSIISMSIPTDIESLPPPNLNPTTIPITTADLPSKPKGDDNAPLKVPKRLPKGVLMGQTPLPDPERWLKKSERSTYGKHKRRGGAGGGATQGSTFVDIPEKASGATGPIGVGKKKGKR